MSFQSSSGTRGGRVPAGPLARWANKMMVNRIRRKGGSGSTLVLTTVGAKSGLERTTPVAWFPGPDECWLIVASAGGAQKNPAWYHNLAAHPGKVRIEVGGREIAVTAEQLHGAEREQAWRQITAARPRFGQYERKTDRALPVIRLVKRSDS